MSGTKGVTDIHEPPFFENFSMEPGHIEEIRNARPLVIFGDSVTTDHISPAGAIKATSPAGHYLVSRGIKPEDFNSYGSRRGNDLVMTRGNVCERADQEPNGPGHGRWGNDSLSGRRAGINLRRGD